MHNTCNKSYTIDVKAEYGTLDGKDHKYIIPPNTFVAYNTEWIHNFSKYENTWKQHRFDNDEFCIKQWFVDENINGGALKKMSQMPFVGFGVGLL